jgi:hypothetical protein
MSAELYRESRRPYQEFPRHRDARGCRQDDANQQGKNPTERRVYTASSDAEPKTGRICTEKKQKKMPAS